MSDRRSRVEQTRDDVLRIFKAHGIEPHQETWEDGDVCILWASTTKASGVTVLIPTTSQGEKLVIVVTSEAMTSFREGSVPEFQLEGQLNHYVNLPDDWEGED